MVRDKEENTHRWVMQVKVVQKVVVPKVVVPRVVVLKEIVPRVVVPKVRAIISNPAKMPSQIGWMFMALVRNAAILSRAIHQSMPTATGLKAMLLEHTTTFVWFAICSLVCGGGKVSSRV